MKKYHAKWVSALLYAVLFSSFGCATTPLPKIIYPKAIYPMNRYPISVESGGLKIAAVPFGPGRDIYADPSQPLREQAQPPLNVLDAGVWPVRLIILNETGDEILIDPNQIIGVTESVSYRTYTPQEATDLVVQSKVFKDATKDSQVGPVITSLLGGDIFVGAVKGGVSGIASGGIVGGASGLAQGAASTGMERAQGYEKALIQLITGEYTAKAVQRQNLYPRFITDGLIFLPSKAGITELRVQAYAQNSKRAISLSMKLK
jgi:hypothetical protein